MVGLDYCTRHTDTDTDIEETWFIWFTQNNTYVSKEMILVVLIWMMKLVVL